MKIKIKENSFAAHMLVSLWAADALANVIFLPPRKWKVLEWCSDYGLYRSSINRMVKSGLLEVVRQGDERILKLTEEGAMQALLVKARMPRPHIWDGKWRLVFFDIPEEVQSARNQLRRLLLQNDFIKIQQSVYLSPYPLNREAVQYLKETKLNKYIRIAKVEEWDDDSEFRNHFKLK